MSLDVSLVRERWVSYDKGVTYNEEDEEVYTNNITHNLNTMAEKAGIYEALWRPYQLDDRYNKEDFENPRDHQKEYEFEESCTITANEIIPILQKGRDTLLERTEYFKQFNPSNGWGTYASLLTFVCSYLDACKEYPDAIVKVSR